MTNLLTLLAVLIPILALPFWFFYFDVTPKTVALLTGVSIACWLAPARLDWQRRSIFERWTIGLLLLQAGFLVLATAFSTNLWLSFSGSNWRRFGLITQLALLLLLILILANGRMQTLPRKALRAIAVSGSAISVYTIAQYFGFDPILPSAAYHIGEGEWTIVRPPGTIGHANYLGCYLLFVVFLGGSLLVREDTIGWRRIGAAAVIVGTFAIIVSGTRSAILGLTVGGVLLAFQHRPNIRRALIGLALVIAGLTSFYVSPWGQKLRSRSRWYQEDPLGGARLLLWRDSFRMGAARPLTGWGPETFSSQFPRFQSTKLSQAYPDFYHESPHNIFLDELVSKGVPAAICLLLWCGLAVFRAFQALRRPLDAPLGAAFLAATITLQFNGFVLTTAFFYFLCGIALTVSSHKASSEKPNPVWRWVAVPAFSAAFALASVCLATSDVLLHRTKDRLEAGDVMTASALYEKARAWQLPGANSDLYYSRTMYANVRRQGDLLLGVKAWQETVQAAIRSTQLGEEPQNAYYHLASLYAAVNNHRDAERSLRSAISVAPNWFKPHWILAQVLAAGGRREESLIEARTALELDGNKHPEVAETLSKLRQKQ